MPGFLSHYIAAQETLKNLAPFAAGEISQKIAPAERMYNLGAQGPDIFFYCLPGIIRKRSRGVGVQMHQSDLGLFIARMAFAAKNSCEKEKPTLFAYTAGLVMHYMLDVHAHPYVYAQTHKEGASKLKNSASHRQFETAVDTALLQQVMSQTPADYHQWQLIDAEPAQLTAAATAASRALMQVYGRHIPPQKVYQAMRHMVGLTRLLRSRKGRRKKWMALAENLTVREPIFSSMVHNQQETGRDYLNICEHDWTPPWEGAKTRRNTFVELYYNAVEEGIDIIKSLHGYVYEGKKLRNLVEKLGNRSLKTGLPVGGAL